MQTIDRAPAQTFILSNKTWEDFEQIERLFEGVKARRLSYFNNEITIKMPGQDHEIFAEIFAALLTFHCFDRRIAFIPTGSYTQKAQGVAAAEADKSYCFGERKQIPDLLIKIVFSSGNETKLPIYQALQVPEVWFWEDGVLKLYRLRATGYQSIDRSEIPALEDLDIALLSRCVLIGETDLLQAIDVLRGEN